MEYGYTRTGAIRQCGLWREVLMIAGGRTAEDKVVVQWTVASRTVEIGWPYGANQLVVWWTMCSYGWGGVMWLYGRYKVSGKPYKEAIQCSVQAYGECKEGRGDGR